MPVNDRPIYGAQLKKILKAPVNKGKYLLFWYHELSYQIYLIYIS